MKNLVRDWALFVLVHFIIIGENLFAPNEPLGDVIYTYPRWIAQGMLGEGWQGITAPGVYPMFALVPMFFGSYGWGLWFAFVIAINAIAFGLTRSHGRVAALAWLGFLALLGPIAVGRIDVFTVAMAETRETTSAAASAIPSNTPRPAPGNNPSAAETSVKSVACQRLPSAHAATKACAARLGGASA